MLCPLRILSGLVLPVTLGLRQLWRGMGVLSGAIRHPGWKYYRADNSGPCDIHENVLEYSCALMRKLSSATIRSRRWKNPCVMFAPSHSGCFEQCDDAGPRSHSNLHECGGAAPMVITLVCCAGSPTRDR